jgi:hypothetical protein
VACRRIGYSIDTYLRGGDPIGVYYGLYWAIHADFARGLSPAERHVVALGSLVDTGAHHGLVVMARECGLSSLRDAAFLMDAIFEPELASLLRQGDAVIREAAARTGVDSALLDAQDSPAFDSLRREAASRLGPIDSRVASLASRDTPDSAFRLYAKTLTYVRENRELFLSPA